MGEAVYAMTRSVPKSFAAFFISSATKAIAKQVYCQWDDGLVKKMYDAGDQSRENYSFENAIADCS